MIFFRSFLPEIMSFCSGCSDAKSSSISKVRKKAIKAWVKIIDTFREEGI